MDIKICIGIWDSKNVFGVPDELAKTILDTTNKFTNSIDNQKCINHGLSLSKIFVFDDLNSIISTLDNIEYTHFILLASGCIILNPELFLQGIKEQIEKNKGMCLSAQILHTGRWKNINNPELFTLHEQMLLFSKHAIQDLKRDNFIFKETCEYNTNEWHKIARDDRNVHDDYTPLDIWPSEDKELISLVKPNTFGMFEDLLQFCIKTNWHIQNFNWEIRNSKTYSYHVDKPKEFSKFIDCDIESIEKNKNLISVKGHYEFFKKMKVDITSWWAHNTEEFVSILPDNAYDSFISVNAGPLPWIYLANYNFEDNTEVNFVDIALTAEKFGKWFIKNYEPNKFAEWHNIVDHFLLEADTQYRPLGNKILSDKLWNEHKDIIDKKWNKIKKFKFNFITEDMITSKNVLDKTEKAKFPLLWFSNIFRYWPTWNKNYKEEDLQNFLNRLIKANRKITWVGASHSNKLSTSPNSIPTRKFEFYQPQLIQPINTNKFLEEILHLEQSNLFTDHRGSDHPGWSSFVLHGLGHDKTLNLEYYGYNNDDEVPYDWTNEALKYCPSIVEYLKSAKIKKRYHRVRIMRLAPGGYISMHDDDPNNYKKVWALNLAINNPKDCEMHFWNDDYQYAGMVPWAPGKAFKIRIHWKHMVMNNSNEVRYHMIVHGED